MPLWLESEVLPRANLRAKLVTKQSCLSTLYMYSPEQRICTPAYISSVHVQGRP